MCGGHSKAPVTSNAASQAEHRTNVWHQQFCPVKNVSYAMNCMSSCQLSVDDVKKISFSHLSWTSCCNFLSDSACPLTVIILCILVNKMLSGLQFTVHAWHDPGDVCSCLMWLLGAILCDLLGLTGLGRDVLSRLGMYKPPAAHPVQALILSGFHAILILSPSISCPPFSSLRL